MKKSNKNNRIFIGDIIKTNKKFKPISSSKKLVKDVCDYKGIIVTKRNNDGKYGVRFGKLSWTNHLDGLLSGKFGYFLDKEEFEVKNEY